MCALCTVDDANYFLVIGLGPKTSVYHVKGHCRVCCISLWCDQLCNNITRVQQARLLAVVRLCQIREASLVALRKNTKFYACSHVSTVRLVQFTKPVSPDSHSHSSPLYHLPGELVSSVPIPSIRSQSVESFTSQRFRPSAFARIHIGLD